MWFKPYFQETQPEFIQIEIVFLIFILISTLVAIAIRVRKIKLPYTVALVLVGLGISAINDIPLLAEFRAFLFPVTQQTEQIQTLISSISIEEVVLALFVAPLVFEASLHLNWTHLRKDLLPVLLLAVPGVLVASFIVGWIIAKTTEIPIELAVAFGALISATDPVAVIAFFRSLGVSKRLAILVEGESLINDGISMVIFLIALDMSTGAIASFNLWQTLGIFLQEAGGGILIGLALGALAGTVLSRLDDYLIETTLTVTVAFGAYVVATQLHTSGILAVVAAGVYLGSTSLHNVSPTTRIALDNFWEFLNFIANSVLFLLIGLRIHMAELWDNVLPITFAILAILVSRAVVVYVMSGLSTKLGNSIPVKYRHVMYWGGLRGAVSLALALSLGRIPYTSTIQAMTFGVVLFTLIAQGLTIEGLIKKLGLSEVTQQAETQRRLANLLVSRAEKQELSRLYHEGMLAESIWQALAQVSDAETLTILERNPELEQNILIETRREMLRSGRVALGEIFRRNSISEEVYQEELAKLDERIQIWDRIEDNFDTLPYNGATS
ncbi:MAG: sodium:proton antiporter [Anaerolineales bacterium]|nr:sodium:proton antiporter [Anaerolineales bacterium]